MQTFSTDGMDDEFEMVTRLQQEARTVSEEDWPEWVNRNKDKVRLSGNDGSIPDQEEWIKRCESFLVCMGKPMNKAHSENMERYADVIERNWQ